MVINRLKVRALTRCTTNKNPQENVTQASAAAVGTDNPWWLQISS